MVEISAGQDLRKPLLLYHFLMDSKKKILNTNSGWQARIYRPGQNQTCLGNKYAKLIIKE